MRAEPVDERDSLWERDDPRFRLFLYAGAANTVSAFDVVDATVDEALETAMVLSRSNEKLWSLAALLENSDGAPGLCWLSGMDYNDDPRTPRQWHLRRQMQDRYLMAKARRQHAPLLPNGLRLIRVFPDWGTRSPLWESFTDEYNLEGNDLGLSAALRESFVAWNREWQARQEDEPLVDAEGWKRRGMRLVGELSVELSGVAEVRPEFLH